MVGFLFNKNFILCGVVVLIFLFSHFLKPLQSDKHFFIKKILDILINVVAYFWISSLILDGYINSLGIYFVIFILVMFCTIIEIFLVDKLYKSKYVKSVTLLSLFVQIMCVFALFYLMLFKINNAWFEIQDTALEALPFSFLYYSFTVSITYSGEGIIATGMQVKILQIIHIMSFYLYIANIFSNIFQSSNIKEEQLTLSEKGVNKK